MKIPGSISFFISYSLFLISILFLSGPEWMIFDSDRGSERSILINKLNSKMEYPEVRDLVSLEANENQVVNLLGIYEEMNVRKKPGSQPILIGRVNIILSDSAYVILETNEKGMRDNSEIRKFRNKRVSVIGKVSSHCTAWGDGIEQSIVGPCIRGIEKISVLKQE